MWSWFTDAASLVAQHPHEALIIAFLAAIIEALAIVGSLVPGTFILMGIAGTASAAGQSMLPYLVVATLGAVVGDFLSYWLGFRFRFTIRRWRPLARRPMIMARADAFFGRYGAASVALCRFIPVLRSTVPLVAGIAGMSRRWFLMANVTSALIWAPAHIWPAQLAGLSIERVLAGDPGSAVWPVLGLVGCGGVVWVLHRYVIPRLLATKSRRAQDLGP